MNANRKVQILLSQSWLKYMKMWTWKLYCMVISYFKRNKHHFNLFSSSIGKRIYFTSIKMQETWQKVLSCIHKRSISQKKKKKNYKYRFTTTLLFVSWMLDKCKKKNVTCVADSAINIATFFRINRGYIR